MREARKSRAVEATSTALVFFCTKPITGEENLVVAFPVRPLGLSGYESINHQANGPGSYTL